MATTPHPLGWIPAPDPRNSLFPMRAALALAPLLAPAPPIAAADAQIERRPGPPVNQGNNPFCVGYTGQNLELAGPVMTRLAASESGDAIYALCKRRDGFPNEDGSTTNALMAVLRDDLHRITAWYWAVARNGRPASEDVREWLVAYGCVALGLWWPTGMDTPDADGTIHDDGAIRGGHEVTLVGYDLARDAFRLKNSWGPSYGQNGLVWLPRADLDVAISNGGEAAGVIEARPARARRRGAG